MINQISREPPRRNEDSHRARTLNVRRTRVAYLTIAYPAISHDFIRRELLEIERCGDEGYRFSICPHLSAPVDPKDRTELAGTLRIQAAGVEPFKPMGFFRAFAAGTNP